MKILWLINIMLPSVSEYYNVQKTNICGWLVDLSSELPKHEKLVVCYPDLQKRMTEIDGVKYYGISDTVKHSDWKRAKVELEEILKSEKPDVIHVWGTEKIHSYAIVEAAYEVGYLEKVVISIQGLVSVYSKHYMANLPWYVQVGATWRDIFRRDTLITEQKEMSSRGDFEKKALQKVKHVIGRTSWDYICTKIENPEVDYHFNNEILRSSFYENRWELDNCERHTIFVSQAQYPIKGFHFVLDAVGILKDKYPDLQVYVAGSRSPFVVDFKPMWYTKYLTKKAKKLGIYNHIHYVGNLSEKQMCEQMLKAHVFVSPSVIENSPNSVGEAMLLGIPTIASYVGGTRDMLIDGVDGYLYQYDAPYMLAGYLDEMFSNDKQAIDFSKAASKHARDTHNPDKNYRDLINIYRSIGGY